MSKRFTDTNKWDQPWFRKLTPKMKCVWSYLCDRCDHAGVWEIDIETLCYFIGEDVSLAEIQSFFENRIEVTSDNKMIIQAFIDFQYGSLNPDNRVHQSVISRLEKIAPNKVLTSSLNGAKDKDKEKDKDKLKERRAKIEEIYSAYYPLKKGKSKGVDKLITEVKTEVDLENLKLSIQRYSASIKDPKYIKLFSTFAHEWKDWLDDDAGKSTVQKNKDMDVSHVWRKA